MKPNHSKPIRVKTSAPGMKDVPIDRQMIARKEVERRLDERRIRRLERGITE